MNRTLALLMALVLGGSSHDRTIRPHTHLSQSGSPFFTSSMGQEERIYYLDLFGHTAKVCALASWRNPAEGIRKLFYGQLSQSEAEAQYDSIAQSLPVVQLSWDGTTASLVQAPSLTLAAGVERCVLVEIQNLSLMPYHFQARFVGSRESNTALARNGITRGLVAQLIEVNAGATQVTLIIKAGTTMDAVLLPVSVVQPARVIGFLVDSDLGQLTPGRVYVRGGDEQLRHGKQFENNNTLSFKNILRTANQTFLYRLPFFYADGAFEIDVPPGDVELVFERGFELPLVKKNLSLAPGDTREVVMASGRYLNMREQGWISGETHVHWLTNNWVKNEDIDLLGIVQKAEDIQVINNLTLRHLTLVNANQYPMGPVPGYASGKYLIHMGEEYRNDLFYGHLNFLNLVEIVQPISTGSLAGPLAEDYPLNVTKIDEAHSQVPPSSSPIVLSAHGLRQATPADVVLGKIDSVDMLFPTQYYSFLDVGLRVPLTDGADHPANLVGSTRCYVKIHAPLTYGDWIEGILSGSTFVTSGPLMFLTVDGTDIGGEVQVSSGASLTLHVEAHSRSPIGRLQVVSNNEFLYDQPVSTSSIVLDLPLTADRSRWIVARCSDAIQPTYFPSLEPNAAHTSATYVMVDNKKIFVDSGAAEYLRDLCQLGGDFVFDQGTFHPPNSQVKRGQARDYFFAGRDAYQAIINANGGG